MNALQVSEALKNLSNDELGTLEHVVTHDASLNQLDRMLAVSLIDRERSTRHSESWGRKAERFWNRHGQTIGAVAVGALLGDWMGD